jgi:hypothetical protein
VAASTERKQSIMLRVDINQSDLSINLERKTQELGYQELKNAGFKLIPADTPTYFEEDNPSLKMIRQILGAVAEYQKDDLIAKLKGARDRKKKINKESKTILTINGDGKCEGRKSYVQTDPELIQLAKKLSRKPHVKMKSGNEVV